MHVNYVWPFRELLDSNERKTFFWLECTYDEALEVLQQVSLSPRDFRNYVEHLARFRDDGNEHKVFGEGLEVYSRIGFLISEDGNIVEWAPPGSPISNMWNAYNPFEPVLPLRIDSISDFHLMADRFASQNPDFSSVLELPSEFSRVYPDRQRRRGQPKNDEWRIELGDGSVS